MKVLWFGRLQEKTGLLQTLEEEARRCQWLVLWLDCDREGENIAYEVVDVCHTTNPQLNIWRAHFSALIERSGTIDPLLCALIPFLEGIPCPLLFLQSIEMLLFLHPSLWWANFSCSTLTSFFLELICRDIHHAAQHLGRPNKMYADAVDARQVLLKETGEYSCVFLILARCPCSGFFFLLQTFSQLNTSSLQDLRHACLKGNFWLPPGRHCHTLPSIATGDWPADWSFFHTLPDYVASRFLCDTFWWRGQKASN